MTYHLLPKEIEALQSAHCLRTGIDVAEYNVCLAAHLGRFERHDVEDGAVGREEEVELAFEVGLFELVV